MAHAHLGSNCVVVTPFRVLVKFAFRTKNQFQPPSNGFGNLSSEARGGLD